MKKSNKLKVYVLMVSQVFPCKHPRAGEETNFLSLILFQSKKHTIRLNFALWEKRIAEINAGRAVLHIRYWTGKPYKSKQQTYVELTQGQVGLQKLTFDRFLVFIDDIGSDVQLKTLAKNDGLSKEDFVNWFKPFKLDHDYAIIHFTKFRYNNSSTKTKTK